MARQHFSNSASRVESLLVVAGIAIGSSQSLAQSSFHSRGSLPGGLLVSSAKGVSADGSVVVGFGYDAAGATHAYRWTQAGGMHTVFEGQLDLISSAFAVSGDGLAIAGYHAPTIIEQKAFIWSAATGEEVLDTRSGTLALNADGTIGAGYIVSGRGAPERAAVWTNGNKKFIDTPGTSIPGSEARGLSADGSIAVGFAAFGTAFNSVQAFRWTAATGMQNIGYLGGNLNLRSEGNAITPDGSVIVGATQTGDTGPMIACRWVGSSGPQLLGSIIGTTNTIAYAVSADGATIVGSSNTGTSASLRAIIWRAETGIQDLQAILNPPPGWTLTEARGISADGRTIVGTATVVGSGSQSWIATLPACAADFDGDGFLTGDDFDQYVAAFEAGSLAADFDHDGFVTGDDFDAFQAAFEAGC